MFMLLVVFNDYRQDMLSQKREIPVCFAIRTLYEVYLILWVSY